MNSSGKQELAIQVSGLSKRYRLGESTAETFREMIHRVAGAFLCRNSSRIRMPPRQFWALKDINFDVKPGEVVGVIGKNGAGKSTVLKIISRITDPTEGQIVINGRVASLLEVGTGFHPDLTGRENIFLNGTLLGMSRAEIVEKFDEIVEFSEIEQFLDTPVKRYSSGMYMRLAFAVAAHLETEIMIIDEVLAVGDIAFQRKCLGKMDEAANSGRTVLFVSHNMGAIQSLCHRVILLENGEIKQEGDPAEVVRGYMATTRIGEDETFDHGYCIDRKQVVQKKTDKVSITDCELVNPKDAQFGPRTGDPLIVRIYYDAQRRCRSPAFYIKIKDSMGYEVIRLSTMPISGFVIEKLHPSGYVQLTIESLPLVAGAYSMDVGFVREGIEWIVQLEDLVRFEVGEQDVYGSGLIMDRNRGLIVVPHGWQHKAV